MSAENGKAPTEAKPAGRELFAGLLEGEDQPLVKDKSGEETTVGAVLDASKDVKLMMFYYTMHNCPGCREFSPLLKELYREVNENGK